MTTARPVGADSIRPSNGAPAATRCCFRRGDLWSPACLRIHQPVGRDDLGAPSTCRGCPRGRGPTRPRHRFCCQKRWENHQGLRFLRWLRVDFHRRRPRRLRPWTRGPWRRWVVTGWQEPGVHCRPPHWLALAVTGAPAEAQRSGFGGERRPSGGNELSGLPGSERSVAWADDAAPRAARIGITRQALTAAALYRLGPPGRRWCHAAERSWRLWRHIAHSESAPPVGRGLAPAGADEGLRVQRTGIYIQ